MNRQTRSRRDNADRHVGPVHPPPRQIYVKVRVDQRSHVPRRVREDAVEADRHQQGAVELLVERDAADRHRQHLAEPLDEPGEGQADEPRRRATEDVADGEHEHPQDQRVPLADPGRQREPHEHAVDDADAVADGDPGHVVLVRLDAQADGVVGDDRLDQGLVGREEDEEDRQGGQPVPGLEQEGRPGSGGQALGLGGECRHGVAAPAVPAASPSL